MNIFDYPMELMDYVRMLLRRKLVFLIPFFVISSLAIGIAFVLPAIFKSEATFIIQRQTIPQNFVATTVTGYIQEQIQQIRQRLVTHENLVRLADTNSLFPEELRDDPSAVVRKLRERIEVEMEDVESTDPNQGGVRYATIAFTVAVSAESALVAQSLTQQLSERYLTEHRDAREDIAGEVTGFLEEESKRLELEIADLEAALAGFKQEEMQQLPELMSMNLNLFERTQQQIDETEIRIRLTQQEINSLRSELSLTEPYKQVVSEEGGMVLTGSQRLSALTAEYFRASSRYSAAHPDVKRLTREIRILSEQSGENSRLDEIMGRLVVLQENLRQAQRKYSDSHPEVQDLERAVASLQRGMQSAIVIDQKAGAFAVPPDNPRYVAISTQLAAGEANVDAEKNRLDELKKKLTDYEDRLFRTPLVERDYKSLARDYQNANSKYQELKNKQLEARLAQQLESGDNAEQFLLASPAFLPTLPESPNRVGISLLGVFFGLLVGLAVVVVVEYSDKTIRNSWMVMNIVGVQPLATIPQMKSRVGSDLTTDVT